MQRYTDLFAIWDFVVEKQISCHYICNFNHKNQILKFVICIVYPRDWLPKFATGLNMKIGCSSKSIWVIKLSFSQNDPLMGESFWQNNSLVTHILFELQPIIIFSPVANFGNQSICCTQITFAQPCFSFQ